MDSQTNDLQYEQKLLEKISLLNGQFLHNDQKIKELLKLNEKLQTTNQILKKKIANK